MTQIDRSDLAARLLHHGADKLQPGDSVVPAIAPTAVFHLPGVPSNAPYQYGRFHNPTWDHLESALSLLENAETVAFPSGMSAIAAVLFTQLKAGERAIIPSDGYYATRMLSQKFLGALGANVAERPTKDMARGGFEGFKLVLLETPSNPSLDVCDIAELATEAKRAGAILAVDNTTMTPFGQRPLDLGAHIAITADTKAMNGHSDTLFGHVATRDAAIATHLRDWRKFSGSVPGPFEAWLVHRGLETLDVRFERMCATAAIIAQRLEGHPKLTALRFPGLANDPSHEIAKRQMTTFGSMISATFKSQQAAEHFITACPLIQPSTSFGGVRTCAERRARWGDAVPEGFVRISIGLEPVEVLWRAIDAALKEI